MNDQQPNIQPETPRQKFCLPVWAITLIAGLSVIVVGGISYAAYQYFTSAPDGEPVVCSMEYAPVCDVDGETHSNACFARVAKVKIDYKGKCQKETEPTACAEDAKVCPDGSSVGRTLPNCEFASCPEVVDETADWQTYRNEEYGFEVRYPEKYKVFDYTGKVIDRSPTVREHNNPIARFTKEGQQDLTAYIEYWETTEGHLNFHKSEPDFIVEVNKDGYITIDYSPGINYPASPELRKEWETILSTFKFIEVDETLEIKKFVTEYLDACIAQDFEKVKSYLTLTAKDQFSETAASLTREDKYKILNLFESNPNQYTVEVEISRNGRILKQPDGSNPELLIIKENDDWKSNTWYLFP